MSLSRVAYQLRTIAVLLSAASLSACASTNRTALYRTPLSWQRGSSDPRAVMETERPSVVRITTVGGVRFVIEQARLVGDHIGGTAILEDNSDRQRGFRVAIGEIARIEWTEGRSGDANVGGFVAGVGLLAAAMLATGWLAFLLVAWGS